MPVYDGINGVVRKRKEWPVGIDGVVRQQKEHWAGIDGVKRQIFSAVTLPEFTVNGRPYQFDPGMTWNTFVSSAYNVDKFWINFRSFVVDPITNAIIQSPSGNICAPSEAIIENGAYITK